MPLRENYLIDQMHVEAARPRPTLREARQAGAALLKRAALLLPDDRALIELAVGSCVSHRQLATMLRRPAGTITRRLGRLLARLYDPLVIALLDPRNPLPPEYRQIGVEHLLQGQCVRQIADRHQMHTQRVQRILALVRGWHRAATSQQNWSSVSRDPART
jgi:DNA-directed RNA polymerase specialized sigma24 family protein